MRISKDNQFGKVLTLALGGTFLLFAAGRAAAQQGGTSQTVTGTGGVSTGTGGGQSFGGSSTISNNGGGGSTNFGNSFSSGNTGSSFGSGGNVTGANSMSNPFTGTNGSSNGITLNGQTVTAGGTAGRPGVGSTASVGPTSGNLFASYYGNPLSMGVLNSTNTSFGQPIYGNTTGTTGTTGTAGTTAGRTTGLGGTTGLNGRLGGTAGINGTSLGGLNSVGASSIGVRRAPAYITTLGYTLQRPVGVVVLPVRADLQLVLGRSTLLPSRDNVQVMMDGETVVLRGRVADQRERRLAENVLRLTPGVREVRNELELPAQ